MITARWACPVGALSWPVHTAAPADDVTTRAITSQLMPAYDVIGGHNYEVNTRWCVVSGTSVC